MIERHILICIPSLNFVISSELLSYHRIHKQKVFTDYFLPLLLTYGNKENLTTLYQNGLLKYT